MKVYITGDIEGITGVDHWNEATIGQPGYERASLQMTKEVAAAAEAAVAAGATEILFQDAHDSARNVDFSALPQEVKTLRGWSDDPRCMAQELDSSFDALLLIGHHAPSSSGGNPLSHSFSLEIQRMKINNQIASEYLILQYTAAYYGVPVIFLSGDQKICDLGKTINSSLVTLAVKNGIGNSAISMHPNLAVQKTKELVAKAFSVSLDNYKIVLPAIFKVEIEFKNHGRAYRRGFYPGVKRINETTLSYTNKDFYEVLRMLLFVAY